VAIAIFTFMIDGCRKENHETLMRSPFIHSKVTKIRSRSFCGGSGTVKMMEEIIAHSSSYHGEPISICGFILCPKKFLIKLHTTKDRHCTLNRDSVERALLTKLSTILALLRNRRLSHLKLEEIEHDEEVP